MENKRPAGLRALCTRIARDFTPWPQSGARVADEITCLFSVLLAIGLSHLLGIRNVSWAAFSAYMVIRASFAESLRRGSLRLLGTAAGVSLAWLLAPALLRSPFLLSAALALAGGVTLYLSVLDRRGYGWLLAGLSFAMVLVDGMEDSSVTLAAFAQSRFAEVCVGTGASVLVSAVASLALRRAAASDGIQQTPTLAPVVPFWHRAAFRHALQGGLALALIPWIWTFFHIKALSQSSITIMAVMMVPLADLAASERPAETRLRHRFIGCGIGGLLATGVLLLSHASPVVMTLAVCLGVVAGRHIENGMPDIGYAGTQLALGFIVVLVPDHYTGLTIAPGLERLFGILIGMALLRTAATIV